VKPRVRPEFRTRERLSEMRGHRASRSHGRNPRPPHQHVSLSASGYSPMW
jgi:hypothetical protein